MGELERLQAIRQFMRNSADQLVIVAEDPSTPEYSRENLRGQAIGLSLAAIHMTAFIKMATDEQWSAGLAKLNGKAA